MKSTDDESNADASGGFSLLGMAYFFVVVALFLFVSTKAGTRGVGVGMMAGAWHGLTTGRIPYGWEGRPPSGYITGWLAMVLSTAFALVGLGILIWPEIAMGIFGWDDK